ncbi:ABC-three component system protein [Paraburkholderia sp. J76]|uniref:ABC-three component system protein n=1 Tax=Paraburkholderia sp. J76 TaxID=2805439 RepID=UPI002ABE2C72|nr:ABC-three component system protein [Paraburkholderia sp. J76]
MTNTNTTPESAISSWGGFVYQGKVALFHAVRLILDKSFNGIDLSEFKLQLDSTDDFAIYINNKAVSVHQVKAKISRYRSDFVKALDKSSKICIDCSPETTRYFHIAQPIDDASDYENSKGGYVKFYTYDGCTHCPIDNIEGLTKDKIKAYLDKHNLTNTDILVEKKYCQLSEMISAHVIKVHGKIHNGKSQNAAAYESTIDSATVREFIEKEYSDREDEEYILLKLRATFADTLEAYIFDEDNGFDDLEIERAQLAFDFLYTLENEKLRAAIASFRPHDSSESLRFDDLQYYADIIMNIACEMIFRDIPHYGKGLSKYLPTAIHLDGRHARTFQKRLSRQILQNSKLISLLFEFDTFIAMGDIKNLVVSESTERITRPPGIAEKHRFNITKMVEMRIISVDVAQEELK